MLIPFDMLKAAQAAVVLLKAEPNRRMGRLRLLSLLYVADRELVKERGRPITGDTLIAMEYGPVLGRTLDLMTGTDVQSPAWQAFVKPDGARDVAAGDDPGVGLLSRREIAKLQLLARRFVHDEDHQLTAYTRGFEEWIKNRPKTGSFSRIPLDDFLEATGMLAKKSALLAIERAERAAEWAFGPQGPAGAVISPAPKIPGPDDAPVRRRKIVRLGKKKPA